ncbi:MAG: hypothetical protein VYD87_13295 [Pseudomonadota bacterium]|nr:hypothetical protein [Pseudomonadota bacterium]MEE3098833.1 hypothetical protein [Pseudomonadota bacterium]
MGNRLRGEVEVVTSDGAITFRFTTNALCALEEDMNMGVAEIGALLSDTARFRIATARKFVRAAMVHRRPDATEDDAGALMDDVGVVEAINAAASAFQLAFPQGDENQPGAGGEAGARPLAEAGGTG